MVPRIFISSLTVALIAAALTIGGCAQNGGIADSYAKAYGDNDATLASRNGDYWYFDRSSPNPSRETSGLLDPVAGLVGEVGGTLKPVVGPVLRPVVGPVDYVAGVLGQTTTTVVGDTATLPKRVVAARVQDSKWYFDSSSPVDTVTAYYPNGERNDYKYGPKGIDLNTRAVLSYVEVDLKSDSGKWYFDNKGNQLPQGYCPTVSATFGPNNLSIRSSDLYDKVIILFADGGKINFSNKQLTGEYRTPKPATGFMIRLRGDGSKWFFDNTGVPLPCGDKWFADQD